MKTPPKDVIFELHGIINNLSTISFSVDYELTLNKRFATQFKKLVEEKGTYKCNL